MKYWKSVTNSWLASPSNHSYQYLVPGTTLDGNIVIFFIEYWYENVAYIRGQICATLDGNVSIVLTKYESLWHRTFIDCGEEILGIKVKLGFMYSTVSTKRVTCVTKVSTFRNRVVHIININSTLDESVCTVWPSFFCCCWNTRSLTSSPCFRISNYATFFRT